MNEHTVALLVGIVAFATCLAKGRQWPTLIAGTFFGAYLVGGDVGEMASSIGPVLGQLKALLP